MSALSRRELLQALLGAPVALEACRRAPPPIRFEGELLGQDFALGHRLRDGGLRERGTAGGAPPRKVGAVIVGAGAAGLSTAWKWMRSGFEDFLVLELEDHLGGTSASGANKTSAFPWGAHYVPAPLESERPLTELLSEMGIVEPGAAGAPQVKEEHLCRAPQERLFMAGAWHEGLYPRFGASAEDLRQLREFDAEMDRWVGLASPEGRRAFTIPMAGCGSTPELEALDQISMGEWMNRRGWTSLRLRWYVDYACRDDYGLSADQTSAWAGIFYFTSRVPHPGAPASGLVTFPEGNGKLIAHLASAAGGRVQPRMIAAGLRNTDAGVLIDAWDARTNTPLQILAEHAVVAAPRYVARRMVEGLEPERGEEGPSYGSWVVANLALRDRPRERTFPLAWDNVLYQSTSLGYVVATHQTGKDYGSTVFTWYLPLIAPDPAQERQHLLGTTWREWADVVLSDLTQAHPDLPGLIERLDVWRWGHAMVRPVVGSIRGESLARRRSPLGRIHFANTDLSGIALFEEAQYWGIRAAEAVLGARGASFTSSLGSP